MIGRQKLSSTANPKLKEWAALHKRRTRDATGQCLVEGEREVRRAIAGSADVAAILTVEAAPDSVLALAEQSNAPHFELSPIAMQRVSRRQHPGAIIAVAATPGRQLKELTPAEPALVLVADGIEKPGNIGAMIRAADGAGADAVVLSDPATDLGNPNVIRASQGAVFGYPVAAAPADAIGEWLASNGVDVVVAADDGATPVWDTDLTGSVAVVIGREDRGASPYWRSHPAVSLPMHGIGDSLNASVAAAVILYEAVRQRRNR